MALQEMIINESNAHEAPRRGGVGGVEVEVCDPRAVAGWDDWVGQRHGATIFHSRAWAELLVSAYGYEPLYFRGGEGGGGCLLPMMEVRSCLTGRRGVGLPFADSCEPLADHPAQGAALWESAVALGRDRGWAYLEIKGGRGRLEDAEPSVRFYGHETELDPEESRMFASLSPGARRAVRRARKQGVTVEGSRSLESLRQFYGLHCATRRRHGVPPQPWHFFRQFHRCLLAGGRGIVLVARHGGRPVAAAVFLRFGHHGIFKYGASDVALQHLRANNLVMWEAMRRMGAGGVKILDWGRTSLGDEGLRRFKKGLGAREKVVEYVKYDLGSGRFMKDRDRVQGRWAGVMKRVPTWGLRVLGRMFYRHVA